MKTPVALALLSIALLASASAQLAETIRAHGGMEKWSENRQAEFDWSWTGSPGGDFTDHRIVDLRTGQGFAETERYRLGGDAREAWVEPDRKALGDLDPVAAFRVGCEFLALPFALGGKGASEKPLGTRAFENKEWTATEVVVVRDGAPPETYVAYADPATQRLRLVTWTRAKPLVPGTSTDAGTGTTEAIAVIFDEWQEAGGLLVPRKGRMVRFRDGAADKPLGTLEWRNVKYSQTAPDPRQFTKPSAAPAVPRVP